MIKAEVIADSVSPYRHLEDRPRITTMVLTYPRFIHSEFMTHRMFSRNCASSRAIPTKERIRRIMEEPALPVSFGKNQRGMQAGDEISEVDVFTAKRWILKLRDCAVETCESLSEDLGLHKQICNRYTEPWTHMVTICTATEWGNFFNLRCHPDADPTFQELAFAMLKAYIESIPKKTDCHLPFGDRNIPEGTSIEDVRKICTARCARVSYLNFDGSSDPQKDIELHDRLKKAGHWSPFEHCAEANPDASDWCGNFRGWIPYRKSFMMENRTGFDPEKLAKAAGRSWPL